MTLRDTHFPTVEEIIDAVRKFVARECDGVWPQDAWCDQGNQWSVNVWTWEDSSDRRITVYRDVVAQSGCRQTDTAAGISIPYPKMWSQN